MELRVIKYHVPTEEQYKNGFMALKLKVGQKFLTARLWKFYFLLHFCRFTLRGLIYINCTIRLLPEYQLLIKHANQLSHAPFCFPPG